MKQEEKLLIKNKQQRSVIPSAPFKMIKTLVDFIAVEAGFVMHTFQ